ncbi:IS3 family transposase [Paenibacillus sp. FSL M7-1455]|uniref:IS3 family transposase n=1 Tax=Paenibacillus sp. FSL M7-1455 TaxID=2975316 RepID=UPI0030F4BD76
MKRKRNEALTLRRGCFFHALESFFSHLKTEGLYPYDIRNLAEAQRRIEKYIRFYNRRRPQRKLNNDARLNSGHRESRMRQ